MQRVTWCVISACSLFSGMSSRLPHVAWHFQPGHRLNTSVLFSLLLRFNSAALWLLFSTCVSPVSSLVFLFILSRPYPMILYLSIVPLCLHSHIYRHIFISSTSHCVTDDSRVLICKVQCCHYIIVIARCPYWFVVWPRWKIYLCCIKIDIESCRIRACAQSMPFQRF